MNRTAIPLADARDLRSYRRLTAAVVSALAVVALVCAVAFALVSRNPQTRTFVSLPAHTNGVLVLDVSASISFDTFSRVGATLATLARSGGRFGLVVESDEAYEALPPGTPAADLAPLVRYFTVPRQRMPGLLPKFPPNPWSTTFTAGDCFSCAFKLATQLAVSQSPRATIVFVSDLDDNPGDWPALATTLQSDRHDGVPVRVIALDATPSDIAFFRDALGPQAPIVAVPTLNAPPPQNVTPFPWVLVALAAAVAAALAARIAWAPRLDWRTS